LLRNSPFEWADCGRVVGKEHPDSPRKIDAAVAAVVAFERAAWHASRPSELIAYVV
jgi:hypothetical protein